MATEILEPQVIERNGPSTANIIAAGGAMQQVRSSYTTAVAVQKPRRLQEVRARLKEEANLAGETFYYGWTVKGDNGRSERIEGKSIGLACAAARCWGNCALEMGAVQDLPDAWVFTASFVDLETGFTMPRQFRQSKRWKVYGKLDDERKADVRFQIGQSKAIRNVIVKALPTWLLDEAMEAAKAGVRAKLEEYIKKNGHAKAVDLLFKQLGKHGVTDIDILRKFEKAKADGLTLDDLVILRGDLSALENGEEYAHNLFPPETPPEPEKGTGSKAEQLAKKLAKGKEAEPTPTQPDPAPMREPGDE